MNDCIVQTAYGPVQGVAEENCIVFKGIPYAEPPVGERRFRAPERPEPFDGIFKADRFPNRCAQRTGDNPYDFYEKEFYTGDEPYQESAISEDGLYLNIWVPRGYKGRRLPVLFYIHGGGFGGGTGHEKEFRTDAYAKRDIILVTINYRLGVFGYLAHPWLYEEDPRACGNYGTLDQLAALTWVKENIAAFGGDPLKITICGQSAGGMSVHTLLSIREADGYYQRAIIQSAGGYPNDVGISRDLDNAFSIGMKVSEYSGAENLQDLRNLSMDELLDIQVRIIGESIKEGIGLPWTPVTNNHLLNDSIEGIMETGQVYPVPTIIGCTRNDITVTPEESEKDPDEIRIHRSDKGYSFQREALQNNPCYVYFFDRSLPGDEQGAFHSCELWYMFGTLKNCWRPMTEGDYRLSEEMLDCWANFIRTGNPNGEGLPVWDTCRREAPYVRIFDAADPTSH